jgi:hypothetical protein
MLSSRLIRPVWALGALLVSTPAASAPAAPKAIAAVAPARAGQPALAVGFDRAGNLRAQVCRAEPCSVEGGEPIALPAAARAAAVHATLAVVGLGKGRHAIVVTVPGLPGATSWKAVVVAPIAGTSPEIVFQGLTGYVEGQEGERHGRMVLVSEPGDGVGRRIVVGEQRENLTICGRATVLAPRLLNPDDLRLHPAKVQRLSASERQRARRVVAVRVEADVQPSPPLLRAVVASSGLGTPAALTDGDPETTWAENRGGSGRGEFVVMNAPPLLPLTALELTIRPARNVSAEGAAPRELWLATDRELLHVTLPEDAWQHPGARYRVPLDPPFRTDCLALVLENTWKAGAKQQVTLAELSARTQFDATQVKGLVGALAGGGERSEAAGAVLMALGGPGFDAVAKAFETLDEGGRRVALDVIDHASCKVSVDVYLKALLSPYRAQRIHARDRIRRCGAQSADALVAALAQGPPRARPLLAGELALAAPDRAVPVIVPLLSRGSREYRRLLRVALGHATLSRRAHQPVRRALADPATGEAATLELLRALRGRLAAYLPESAQALTRLSSPTASFRTRYLVLEAAAELAKNDRGARALLRRALIADRDGRVRAQAARVVPDARLFQSDILRALEDTEVRVREAAAMTLRGAGSAGSFAGSVLARRLRADDWPLVRAAAAAALGQLGQSSELDSVLGGALEDESPFVRAPAVTALGVRRAHRCAKALRDLLENEKEAVEVRIAAADALGQMCDRESLDILTKFARRLESPFLTGDLREIAPVALGALARIHPPDLKSRLTPLLAAGAPPLARRAAQSALVSPSECGRAAPQRVHKP